MRLNEIAAHSTCQPGRPGPNGDGQLDPYEDWRLSAEQRAADLVSKMTLEEKAGLMLIQTQLNHVRAEARCLRDLLRHGLAIVGGQWDTERGHGNQSSVISCQFSVRSPGSSFQLKTDH